MTATHNVKRPASSSRASDSTHSLVAASTKDEEAKEIHLGILHRAQGQEQQQQKKQQQQQQQEQEEQRRQQQKEKHTHMRSLDHTLLSSPSKPKQITTRKKHLYCGLFGTLLLLLGSSLNVLFVHRKGTALQQRKRMKWLNDYIESHYSSTSTANGKEGASGTKTLTLPDNSTLPAHARNDPNFISLNELVLPKIPKECPSGLYPAPVEFDSIADLSGDRKIPRIVHQTGRSPCLTKPFFDGALQWTFPNHSYYFHDDVAVDHLFERSWPEFPQIKNSFDCLKHSGGAAKADLWRYLALYEYGGIYTDMDNLPNVKFLKGNAITDDMDAFFLQERGGWLSQFFFAVSPKHPLMFLAVHDVMSYMHSLSDIGNFYVPQVTGPGAIKRAFLKFMGMNDTWSKDLVNLYSKPPRGFYEEARYHHQRERRSVTVEGSRRTSNEWILRSAIGGREKRNGWKAMNISDYQALNKKPSGITCLMHLFEAHHNHNEIW